MCCALSWKISKCTLCYCPREVGAVRLGGTPCETWGAARSCHDSPCLHEPEGGLPASCDLDKLKSHFSQFGEIHDAVAQPLESKEGDVQIEHVWNFYEQIQPW